MKKNLLKVLVVGCMVVSSVPTSVFASTVNTDNIKENTIEQTQEVGTLDSWLKEYILSLKGINNDEKQKLFESEKVIVLSQKYFYFQFISSIYTCLILISFSILFTYIELPNYYLVLIVIIFNFIIFVIKNIAIKKSYLQYSDNK